MKISGKTIKQSDSKGRINIGPETFGTPYSIEKLADGRIILDPVVVRPEREQWLYDNDEAMASVQRGLEQSARDEGVSLGSFAQYADADDDEE